VWRSDWLRWEHILTSSGKERDVALWDQRRDCHSFVGNAADCSAGCLSACHSLTRSATQERATSSLQNALFPGANLGLTRNADEQLRKSLEARVGIEPTHKGFADLSLTTWVPRPCSTSPAFRNGRCPSAEHEQVGNKEIWSGRRDLNPRLRPWQGRTLPLSYSRSTGNIVPFTPTRRNSPAGGLSRSCRPLIALKTLLEPNPAAKRSPDPVVPHAAREYRLRSWLPLR
jgi:hypothetical protein